MKQINGTSLFALTTFAALCLAPVAHAQIFSDDFNGENGGAAQLNYNGFDKWNVTRQSVDLIGNGSFDFYPGNGLYVDLDGSTGSAGRLETKSSFVFNLGQTYFLDFDLGNNDGNNTATVSVDGFSTVITTMLAGAHPTYNHLTYSFVGDGLSSSLVFDHAGADNQGLVIDNVALSTNSTAVPEPGSVALVAGLGTTMLGLLARKRRRN